MAMAAVQAAQQPQQRPAAAPATTVAVKVLVPDFNNHVPGAKLPPLHSVKNRDTYRERPADEREEVTWYEDDDKTVLAIPQLERLLSRVSRAPCIIVFTNKTPFKVRPLWMDFNGIEVAYTTLQPGETKRFRTYESHPWIVREETTGARMMLSGYMAVVGLKQEQEVAITAPPALAWTMERHSCFPGNFKAAAKTFLLAHKRAEAADTVAICRAGAASAATATHSANTATQHILSSPCRYPCCTSSNDLSGAAQRAPAIISIDAYPGATVTATVTLSPRKAAPSNKLFADAPCGQDLAAANAQNTVNIQLTTSAHVGMVSATVCVSGTPNSHGNAEGQAFGGCYLQHVPASHACYAAEHVTASGHSKSKIGNLLSSIKGLLSGIPSSGTYSHQTRDQDGAEAARKAQRMRSCSSGSMQRVDDSRAGPCSTFGLLPNHLVVRIVEMAAPKIYQHISRPALGRPDILPTLLACSPDESARQAQADAAAQAAAQGAANGNNAAPAP